MMLATRGPRPAIVTLDESEDTPKEGIHGGCLAHGAEPTYIAVFSEKSGILELPVLQAIAAIQDRAREAGQIPCPFCRREEEEAPLDETPALGTGCGTP